LRVIVTLFMVLAMVPAYAAADENARFTAFVEATLDAYWKLNPEHAFNVGYYKYADRASVPDAAARARARKLADDSLAALAGFDPKRLSASNRVDDGYAEIRALRDEEKARLGKSFSLKEFNNRFLSYGSAPVRYIRELMREGK
jgi:uncharacterized protein (DUF885 family)